MDGNGGKWWGMVGSGGECEELVGMVVNAWEMVVNG